MNEQFVNDLAVALRKVGTIHVVGEEWHSYTGEIPVGGVPYDGYERIREVYSALWSYAQEKGLVKTEAEWQEIANANGGNVPFYSDGDGSTTFRLPRIIGYVKGASIQSETGAYIAEGLPSVDHYHIQGAAVNNTANVRYGMTDTGVSGGIYDTGSGTTLTYGINTSSVQGANSIYGNSEHVTPETSVVMFGVYAFGAIVETGELDATTLATGLARVESNLAGTVRSVNGVYADTDGNVTIEVGTGSGSGSDYTLPTATSSVLGGVTIGDNITITSGKISVTKENVNSALGITGLATVATSGKYSDLSGTPTIPTSLPANGGNASTVGGFTVGTNVPSDAKFMDTVYTHPASHDASMITGLAKVATSGSYNDLSNKPTIPSAYTLPTASSDVLGGVKTGSNITNSSGTISITKDNVTGALGYTPPNGTFIPLSGSRGNMAGYNTPSSVSANVTIDGASSDDVILTSASKITISNGSSGQSWIKTVAIQNASATIALGSSWKWINGEVPTVSTNSILVLKWMGTFGMANLVVGG